MRARLYSSSDLVVAAREQFPLWRTDGPCVMNNVYAGVSRAWVERQFACYLWEFETRRRQRTWQKRGNQCEHFALRAALEVVNLLAQMSDGEVPAGVESVAIAACKYLQHAGTPHAGWHEVNLWMHDGVWCPWEPQTHRYFAFTEAERATVQQLIIP